MSRSVTECCEVDLSEAVWIVTVAGCILIAQLSSQWNSCHFSGHLVLHLPTSCQWFWRLQVIWELHVGEHVICSLQLNLRLTRPVIYLNTMESIFCLFLLKIPLVFKEFLKWDVSLHYSTFWIEFIFLTMPYNKKLISVCRMDFRR